MEKRLRRSETFRRSAALKPAKPARPPDVLENFALFGAKSFKNDGNRVILKKRFFLGGVSQNRPPPRGGGNDGQRSRNRNF
jgi:hypothetical protein